MNCTDRIVVGLLLVVGGLWLDAALLPGSGLPAFGIGLGLLVLGMWQAGKAVARGGR